MSRTARLFRATVILGASLAGSACGDSQCRRCAIDGRVADVSGDGVREDAGTDADPNQDAPVDTVLIL
jgi:hypothetical protein